MNSPSVTPHAAQFLSCLGRRGICLLRFLSHVLFVVLFFLKSCVFCLCVEWCVCVCVCLCVLVCVCVCVCVLYRALSPDRLNGSITHTTGRPVHALVRTIVYLRSLVRNLVHCISVCSSSFYMLDVNAWITVPRDRISLSLCH